MKFVKQLSNQLDNQLKPMVHNIQNFSTIVADIEQHKQLFEACKTLYGKRVKIQKEYSEKLSLLGQSTLNLKVNQKQNKSSFILYQNILESFREQSLAAENIAAKIDQQILVKMRKFSEMNDGFLKKLENNGNNYSTELINQTENFNKVYTKYLKKADEIIKNKTLCIVSKINPDIDFYQINKLHVKIDNTQKEFITQKEIYNSELKKLNENVDNMATKISNICSKIYKFKSDMFGILKDSVIVMEKSKSIHGTTLIRNTHQKLQRIDLILEDNSHTLSCREEVQKNIKKLKRDSIDPSAYISNLFADIENKNLQNLVNYGQLEMQKKRINSLFQNPEEYVSEDPQISKETARVVQIFKILFDQVTEIKNGLLEEFVKLIQRQSYRRKDFIFCLQRFRLAGKFELPAFKINEILNFLKIFLTKCMQDYDTHNPKMLMILSCSYYFKKNAKEEIYMYQFLKDHNIWKNMQWWNCAILESIFEEIKIKNKKQNSFITEWHIKTIGCEFESNQQPLTYSRRVSSQLGAFVHNMGLFQVPPSQILKLTKQYQNLFSIPQDEIYHIIKLIEGFDKSYLIKTDSKLIQQNR